MFGVDDRDDYSSLVACKTSKLHTFRYDGKFLAIITKFSRGQFFKVLNWRFFFLVFRFDWPMIVGLRMVASHGTEVQGSCSLQFRKFKTF